MEDKPHPTFNPSNRFQAMKDALEKVKAAKSLPAIQTVEKPAVIQALPDSTVEADDEDMEELLMLASGITEPKSANNGSSAVQCEEPSMIKSANLAGIIEEGRVLVSGPIQHTPTHNFNSFETTMLESLNYIGIQKPKLIQAHVWEPILSLSDVAYVSGSKTGKTLGYLVPVINNLLDEEIYTEVPKGCSPLAIVICPSWRDAETVHEYFTQMTRSVKGFCSGVVVDGSSKSLNESVKTLVNGVTLLAATAPALRNLFQEANCVINFDRCRHLIFENTDLLLKDHGEAFKHLVELYYSSCKRTKNGGFNFVRQIISCSEHWTKGMQSILDQVMKTPYLFIASCLEAAIYGGMELDVRHGTSSEMDSSLLKIIDEKRTTRTIVFCRSNDEITKLQDMLSTIGVKPLVAHNRSVVSDLDSINRRWDSYQPGCAILLCTDDVLYRLNIKNAQTLIHYFFPPSKYDFSLRFSFALDRLKSLELEEGKPVSHLLITEEFKKALLTIVRIMPRFGHVVSEDLKKEAMLSYCDKEFSKTQLPLCIELKSFGTCRNTKLCLDRHLIMESFDKPVVPNSGIIQIRITAVDTTTRYFARILKYQSGDQFVDASASYFEVNQKIRNHYISNAIQPALVTDVKVGNWYARRSADDLFERVRVEEVLNYNHQKIPLEVAVISVDQGRTFSSFVQDLIELPGNLKALPPQAIEVFLAGVKPLDKNTEWSRRSIEFARAKLMNKVLDGHIVLALSSSLWLKPLHERKTLDGMKDRVVVMDILSDLIKEEMAVKHDDHMAMLYRLCETGGMVLPDHSSSKKEKEVPTTAVSYSFLSLKMDNQVEVSNVVSPSQFYVVNCKFQKILADLEIAIRQNISMYKKLSHEEVQPGKLVIAEEPRNPGAWCRGVVKKVLNESFQYHIFFVDYGDFSKVSLNDLRALPQECVTKLPFQAIACSLKGLKPAINSTWTEEANNYFSSLTRDSDNYLRVLNAIPEAKQQIAHEVTGGPHYLIHLINRDEGEPRDLTQEMISSNFALTTGKSRRCFIF